MAQFQESVEAAIAAIPKVFSPLPGNTVFIVEESSSAGIMGLYEGATALHAGEGLPERITLYKRPHEAAAKQLPRAGRRGAPNHPARGRPPLRHGGGRAPY